MPTLLCFGDSNTHGTPPIVTRGVYARFDAQTRWPRVAAGLCPAGRWWRKGCRAAPRSSPIR
jgi:lysophospholipase L1-like esterase